MSDEPGETARAHVSAVLRVTSRTRLRTIAAKWKHIAVLRAPRSLFHRLLDGLGCWIWPGRHFESLYANQIDPWKCLTSQYERLKTERTRYAIGKIRPRASVLDIGCGEGILPDLLGEDGHDVWAYEVSRSAANRAKERCARHPNVHVREGDIRRHPIVDENFDVVVMAEVLYYFGHHRKQRLVCDKLVEKTSRGGHIVVVDPWPAARAIERELEHHPEIAFISRLVCEDPGRSYAISVYRRASR